MRPNGVPLALLLWYAPHNLALAAPPGGTPARPLPVVVTASHHGVLPHWLRLGRNLPPGSLTIVHLDAHPDMALPHRPFPRGLPRRDDDLQASVDIASFQLAAVRTGITRRILWIRPVWATQIPDGEHKLRVGNGPDGSLRADSRLDYHVLTPVFWVAPDQLRDFDPLTLRVMRLEDPADPNVRADEWSTAEAGNLLVDPAGPLVLDIDLDLFSTRNPAVDRLLAVGFTEEEVTTIRRLFARENLDFSADPRERQAELRQIENAIAATTAGAWNEVPGALFALWRRGLSPIDLFEMYGVLDGKSEEQLTTLLREGFTVVGVPVHKSEQAEIEAALRALDHLVRNRIARPALVTIARSMGDGFTHPYWLGPAEMGTLEVLEKALGPLRISYDTNRPPLR